QRGNSRGGDVAEHPAPPIGAIPAQMSPHPMAKYYLRYRVTPDSTVFWEGRGHGATVAATPHLGRRASRAKQSAMRVDPGFRPSRELQGEPQLSQKRLQPVRVRAPAADRALVNRLTDLSSASGVHRALGPVKVQAPVVPFQAAMGDDPPR